MPREGHGSRNSAVVMVTAAPIGGHAPRGAWE